VAAWRSAWDRVIPFFAYPPTVRKLIYTTNAIESLHSQLRKIIKTRGALPQRRRGQQTDLAGAAKHHRRSWALSTRMARGHRARGGLCHAARRAGPGDRFFVRRARAREIAERKSMIDPTHELPVVQQTRLLSLARSTAYYQPRPIPVEDLELMRQIDRLHLEHPFAGARMLRDFLLQHGHFVGRKHVATLMRLMGIEALYNRPNTRRPPAISSTRI
jgi:hypothetical protein